jgi:hypothetical protein
MFDTLIKRLNDTRILSKLFLAPTLITVFMIVTAAVAQYGSRQQSAALDQVANVAFAKDELAPPPAWAGAPRSIICSG